MLQYNGNNYFLEDICYVGQFFYICLQISQQKDINVIRVIHQRLFLYYNKKSFFGSQLYRYFCQCLYSFLNKYLQFISIISYYITLMHILYYIILHYDILL